MFELTNNELILFSAEHIKRNRGKYSNGRLLEFQFKSGVSGVNFPMYDYLLQHYVNIEKRGFQDLDNTSNKLVQWFNFISHLINIEQKLETDRMNRRAKNG